MEKIYTRLFPVTPTPISLSVLIALDQPTNHIRRLVEKSKNYKMFEPSFTWFFFPTTAAECGHLLEPKLTSLREVCRDFTELNKLCRPFGTPLTSLSTESKKITNQEPLVDEGSIKVLEVINCVSYLSSTKLTWRTVKI